VSNSALTFHLKNYVQWTINHPLSTFEKNFNILMANITKGNSEGSRKKLQETYKGKFKKTSDSKHIYYILEEWTLILGIDRVILKTDLE
jgi:hypothetical protein